MFRKSKAIPEDTRIVVEKDPPNCALCSWEKEGRCVAQGGRSTAIYYGLASCERLYYFDIERWRTFFPTARENTETVSTARFGRL